MSENTGQQVDQIEALFVQSAHGLTTSNGSVTFHGLAHSTLFFSDRPQRVVGHVPRVAQRDRNKQAKWYEPASHADRIAYLLAMA